MVFVFINISKSSGNYTSLIAVVVCFAQVVNNYMSTINQA